MSCGPSVLGSSVWKKVSFDSWEKVQALEIRCGSVPTDGSQGAPWVSNAQRCWTRSLLHACGFSLTRWMAGKSSSHRSRWPAFLSTDDCLRIPAVDFHRWDRTAIFFEKRFLLNWLFLKPHESSVLWNFPIYGKTRQLALTAALLGLETISIPRGQSNASCRASEKCCTLAYMGWSNLKCLY